MAEELAPFFQDPSLDGTSGTMETKEDFYRRFQLSVASLKEQIAKLPSYSECGGERQDAVEHALGGISYLSSRVADAAHYLPTYDQRTYSEAIKSLKEQVSATTAQFAPKNRFQFKKRAAGSNSNSNSTTTISKTDSRRLQPATPLSATTAYPTSVLKQVHDADTAAATTPGARELTLSDKSRVHLILPASPARAGSAVAVTNLSRCLVDMTMLSLANSIGQAEHGSAAARGNPSGGLAVSASVTLKDIEGSAVAAGHVDGPVHVTCVRNSVVVVTARQVRVHRSENVVLYLHCTSRPIIENCVGVRFARAPAMFLTDKQKGETNMFDQVDDFKWLKTTPSPNWSVLPESEAIPDDAWKQALARGIDSDIDDTLHILGVGKGAYTG